MVSNCGFLRNIFYEWSLNDLYPTYQRLDFKKFVFSFIETSMRSIIPLKNRQESKSLI